MSPRIWISISFFFFFSSPLAISGQELNFTSISMYWDDHISVCFEDFAKISHYKLITSLRQSQLENTTDTSLDTTGNETCIISKKKYQLGGFYSLFIDIESYFHNGTEQGQDRVVWNYIFPGKNCKVQAAATTSMIFTTWHILDNVDGISFYNLTLYSSHPDKKTTVILPVSRSFYIFNNHTLGKHSVCLKAVRVETFDSIESATFCSDILDIRNNAAVIPTVKNVKVLPSSPTTIFVKWEYPDRKRDEEGDITFIVNWGKINKLISNTSKSEVFASAVHPWTEGHIYHVKFVKKFFSSMEIENLEDGMRYTVCVIAVKQNMASNSVCQDANLKDYSVVFTPEDLQYTPGNEKLNGSFSWTQSLPIKSYWLEWYRNVDEVAGHADINKTRFNITLQPGGWNVSVRALTNESVSFKTYGNVSVNGLIISYQQLETQSVSVAWDEWPVPTVAAHYNATVKDKLKIVKTSEPVLCSGHRGDCFYHFMDLGVSVPTTLKVYLQDDDGPNTRNALINLYAIEDVSGLQQVHTKPNEITVAWNEAKDAKIYILSVYSNQNLTVLRFRSLVTLPTRFTVKLRALDGNVVQVQPCKDADHCGNYAKLILNTHPPPPSSHKGAIIAVFVVGTLVAIPIIVVVVMKKKKKRRRRRRYHRI